MVLREYRHSLPATIVLPAYFVWVVWATITLATFTFVWKYGTNVPFWDEWNLVEIITGTKPISIEWLWSEHNGHRIPFPRLILIALLKFTQSDFRSGMYFNVTACSIMSFLAIVTANKLRGSTAYTDVFFPLLLLNWGHYENLLWNWQVTQVIAVFLAFLFLTIVALYAMKLPSGVAIFAGFVLILLPLCGVPGLVYVPALALFLGFSTLLYWPSQSQREKVKSLVLIGLIIIAFLLVALSSLDTRKHRDNYQT